SEVMVPAKFFVQPDDPITKAAYLMVHNDLALLPVLENKKKFVGLVRIREVFDELSSSILEG
ncbi:MAG: CBS domain-containing protein, partial [Thermodesulfovibrionales bacterium]